VIVPQLDSFWHAMNDPNAKLTEKLVCVDTSFVWELMGPPNDKDPVRENECQVFSRYLASVKSIRVINPKVHEELRGAISAAIIQNYRESDQQTLKMILRKNPQIYNEIGQAVSNVTTAIDNNPTYLQLGLENFSHEYIRDNIDPLLSELMYADAFHYAFSKREGISDFISLDHDFVNVNNSNFHLITDTGNYLKILIRDNKPIPQPILEYYIRECEKSNMALPYAVNRYYQGLQRLKQLGK
jgi:hypothetical protein